MKMCCWYDLLKSDLILSALKMPISVLRNKAVFGLSSLKMHFFLNKSLLNLELFENIAVLKVLLCFVDEQLWSLALPGAAISSRGGDGVRDCGLEDPENGC